MYSTLMQYIYIYVRMRTVRICTYMFVYMYVYVQTDATVVRMYLLLHVKFACYKLIVTACNAFCIYCLLLLHYFAPPSSRDALPYFISIIISSSCSTSRAVGSAILGKLLIFCLSSARLVCTHKKRAEPARLVMLP